MAEQPASFAEWWDRQARERSGRTALSDHRRSLTWDEGADASCALARGLLALGLEPRSVVACWLPNRVESYLTRIACERAGFIWLPIPARLREWELQKILERAEPSALIVPSRFHDRDYVTAALGLSRELRKPPILLIDEAGGAAAVSLDEIIRAGRSASAPALPEQPPEDALVILPTSGSTGIPKFAQYRISAWLMRARAQAELFELSSDDVVMALSQGIGPSIVPLFAAPLAGAAAWLIDEFDAERVVATLSRVRPTIVCGVPAQMMTLLDHPGWSSAAAEGVRIWYTTGAAFPPAAAARLESSTRGIVLCGYGGMDFGGWTVPSPNDAREVRLQTVGPPRGETEVMLVDDAGQRVGAGETGEIWGRGPCCAIGYFRDEAATRERWTAEGWFRTGDLGRFDAAGNLSIMGRKADSIRRGGMTIQPGEIEALLSAYPKIERAAVVGFSDSLLGERACAVVVPRAGAALTLEELTAYLRGQRIATFKLPERLEIVGELPLRGDKVDRLALRRSLEERSPQTGAPSADRS